MGLDVSDPSHSGTNIFDIPPRADGDAAWRLNDELGGVITRFVFYYNEK